MTELLLKVGFTLGILVLWVGLLWTFTRFWVWVEEQRRYWYD